MYHRFIVLCFLAFLFVCGAFAQADSLNVRHHWTLDGRTGYNLAMADDTTLWFVEPGTDNLIEVDASNPDAIDTNFYDMDSLMYRVLGIVNDSMLLVGYGQNIRTINIRANPPSLVSSYQSSHLVGGLYLRDSMLVSRDRAYPDSCLAFFNVSDPTNIDTFATGINATIYADIWGDRLPYYMSFAARDSILYLIVDKDYGWSGDPYEYCWPANFISIFNISDYSNPVFDTTYPGYMGWFTAEPVQDCPSIVVDSFLYVGMNHDECAAVCYDISDPTQLSYLGLVGSYFEGVGCMAYQNGYLYAGTRIYNISSSPTGDSLVGFMYDGYFSKNEVVNGRYIYRLSSNFDILDFYEYLQVYEPSQRQPQYEHQFYLSPNPANKYSYIRFNEPVIGEIEIYNIRGQKMMQRSVVSQNLFYPLDLSEYSPGLYLVSVRVDIKRFVGKLLVIG